MAKEKILDNEAMSDEELDNVAGGGYIYYTPFEQDGVSGYAFVRSINPLNSKAEVLDFYANKTFEQTIETTPEGETRIHNVTVPKGFVPQDKAANFVERFSAYGNQFVDFNSLA